MADDELTPADAAHLKFLRQQLDRLEHLRFTRDAPKGLDHQLHAAREELRRFVAGKRMQGYNI